MSASSSPLSQSGSEYVECRLCADATMSRQTWLCDRCWELERRIHADPALARRILESLQQNERGM